MDTRDLQVFTNEAFGTIRTVEYEGKVYFCGRDVASALGYANTGKAIEDHCCGGPFCYPIVNALGHTQEMRFISEGDLYRLIFSSELPAARDFETWVVDEVLPAIRRCDVYTFDEHLENDKLLECVIIQLRSERAKRLVFEQELLEAAPKVAYYDVVLQSDSLLTITEIAKDYGVSAKRLNLLLHDAGIQFRQSGRWFLYAQFAGKGYTQSKTYAYDEGKTRTHMYWTQKGRLFVYNLLKNQFGLLPVMEQDGGAA